MKVREELERRRIPCGPVTVDANAVCRRRLKDKFDNILGKLSELTDQEYQTPQAPEGYEMVDGKIMSQEQLKEQKHEEKRGDLLKTGIMRNEVAAEVAKHKEAIMPKKKKPEKPKEPTLEEKRKTLLDEAKMKAEVKVKAKEHEARLEGNSRLLQRKDGKIEKR